MSTQIHPVSSNSNDPLTSVGGPLPSKTTTRAHAHPRWLLSVEANFWRFLEQIGVYLHGFPSPTPPQPSFIRQFQTTNVGDKGTATLVLVCYVPDDYEAQKRQGRRYPVVVNLHGGGFTLGTARDDSRWAAMVLQHTNAVFISVEYRLAPEFPFPTAVEDGVEALLHLAANSEEFGIDPKRMALSGFSAGGNMSFTIPLRLRTHLQSIQNEVQSKSTAAAAGGSTPSTPTLPRVVSIVAWYPSVDNRISRDQRRAGCVRPEKTLPPFLTNLFDESYLPDLDNKRSPYASPAAASDEELVAALPDNIAMYLCEWDMLLQEGEVFAERLKGLGKRVHCVVIEEKRHGFDKSPYPFSVDPKVGLHYTEACAVLKDAFGS